MDMALCVTEAGPNAPETHILLRGNPNVPGEKVEPGFPEVISKIEPNISPSCRPTPRRSGRRLVLADWIVSKDNPLDGARHRQSRLAKSFRARHRPFSQRFRLPGIAAHASGTSRLARGRIRREWLALQALHRLILTVQRLPDVVQG